MQKAIFYDRHSAIMHKMAILRNKETSPKVARELVAEITSIMMGDILRDTETESISVQTPLTKTVGQRIHDKTPCIVPVLRAGLGMELGAWYVLPTMTSYHFGARRIDGGVITAEEYLNKIPRNLNGQDVILLDPMLATGSSACLVLRKIKDANPGKITFACIVSCDEGLNTVLEEHPDVQIYCANKDQHLNDHGYIVPGLGDMGDNLFGTKKAA